MTNGAGVCAPTRALGEACTGDDECAEGSCVGSPGAEACSLLRDGARERGRIPFALLSRLSRMAATTGPSSVASAAQADADRRLADGLAALREEVTLEAVPIATLVELQTRAILATARALSR
jgi:hypothetical protein